MLFIYCSVCFLQRLVRNIVMFVCCVQRQIIFYFESFSPDHDQELENGCLSQKPSGTPWPYKPVSRQTLNGIS